MNKRILIYLLNKYIDIFLNGELTLDKCTKIFNERLHLPLDDNIVLYEEAKLLCRIYENISYYDIDQFLFSFKETLYRISENDKKMNRNFNILISYLDDITNNLSSRIKTEIDFHIYTMLKEYILYESLDAEKNKKLILVNKVNPIILFSLDIAENCFYKQESVNLDSKENLRDEISKSNYSKSRNIEKIIYDTIFKNFSKDEFKAFFNIIITIIREINNNKLEDLYTTRYNEILKNCSRKWSNQSSEEPILLFSNSDINY